ncbi:hypothetical protein D3C74_49880 [compost metagenome]
MTEEYLDLGWVEEHIKIIVNKLSTEHHMSRFSIREKLIEMVNEETEVKYCRTSRPRTTAAMMLHMSHEDLLKVLKGEGEFAGIAHVEPVEMKKEERPTVELKPQEFPYSPESKDRMQRDQATLQEAIGKIISEFEKPMMERARAMLLERQQKDSCITTLLGGTRVFYETNENKLAINRLIQGDSK